MATPASAPIKIARAIEAELKKLGSAERAVQEKRYLKSELSHFGVPMPALRRVTRQQLKAAPGLSHAQLKQLISRLWNTDLHELRVAALVVVRLRVAELQAADLPMIERMLRQSRTWAYVDDLAAHAVGNLALRFPQLMATLDRWAVDKNFWIRRSALLALLLPLRNGAAQWPRFAGYAELMLDEDEFFIRKAIGWVLREVSKTRPQLVLQWLLPRAARASGVTWREALRYLSPAQRKQLERARARGRASGNRTSAEPPLRG